MKTKEVFWLERRSKLDEVKRTIYHDRRIGRDEMFMEIADTVALRSTCKRAQVGAILVVDKRMISMGYNGSPAGMAHCIDVGCLEAPNEPGCVRTVHAEANVIAFAAKVGIATNGGTLYSTHAPCINCAKLLINAGIKRIVYHTPYRDPAGLNLLKEAGIETVQM